jgi:porin
MVRPAAMNTRALVFCAFLPAVTGWGENAELQPQPWTQWDLATGDWNRNRALLEDRGCQFIATYTSQTWGNVTGGVRQGATYGGLLQFGAELDLGKLVGWKGGSFNTTWLWIHGGNPTTSLTGAPFPASGIEAPNGFRALDLWFQQKFPGEVLTLRAGLFNADRDFTISENCQLFLNAATGWPILYDGELGGPPAYPFAAPGIYAAVEPGGGWKFQAAALQVTVWPPAENPANFHWQLSARGGILYLGEVHYGWTEAVLPGTAKIGVMLDSGLDSNVDGRGSTWGSSFFYGIIDQWLWREDGSSRDSPQGIAWFNRTGWTGTPDSSPLGMIFNTGFTWTGLFPGRDEDAAGLAFVWSRLLSGEVSQIEGGHAGDEFAIELTYQVQLTPWFELQPDIQYLMQPGGSSATPGALVLGLSATINF